VAVVLARPDSRQIAVPVERRPLGHLDAALLLAVVVEQAQLHAHRVLGEEREVDAFAVPRRSEREGVARPDLAHRSRAPESGSNVMLPSPMRCAFAATTTSLRVSGSCASAPPKLAISSNGSRTTRSHF